MTAINTTTNTKCLYTHTKHSELFNQTLRKTFNSQRHENGRKVSPYYHHYHFTSFNVSYLVETSIFICATVTRFFLPFIIDTHITFHICYFFLVHLRSFVILWHVITVVLLFRIWYNLTETSNFFDHVYVVDKLCRKFRRKNFIEKKNQRNIEKKSRFSRWN